MQQDAANLLRAPLQGAAVR